MERTNMRNNKGFTLIELVVVIAVMAVITTVFGIIVAVILQLFYNYILSRIDHITSQMEETTITMIDIITSIKRKNNG